MPKKDEAAKAISTLNDQDLKGRPVMVNEACPRTDRPRTGGGGGRGRLFLSCAAIHKLGEESHHPPQILQG